MKKPDERLGAAAELVRQGAVFADIGTDHALLPIFLCREGRVRHAYAADINEGPLASARAAVSAAGLSDKITPVLTDGLQGLSDRGLTDIAICGMGGELIVSILSAAPFVKNPDIRLILQPMSRPEDLRYYLADEGFEIIEERAVFAAGRCYFCLAVHYTGVPYSISRIEAALGRLSGSPDSDAFLALLEKHYRSQQRKCEGLRRGGTPDSEEEAYLWELCALLKEKKHDRP